jgi:hypothetical protein
MTNAPYPTRERGAREGGAAVFSDAAHAVRAQALIPRSEIERVRALSLTQLRSLAAGQIKKAQQAWEKASGVAWYQGLYVRWLNSVRWKPEAQSIAEAEELLALGDRESTDADRRTRYTSAWTRARLAVDDIAKEAGFGPTDFYFIADVAADEAKRIYADLKPQIDTGLVWVKWGVLGGVALWLFDRFGGRR